MLTFLLCLSLTVLTIMLWMFRPNRPARKAAPPPPGPRARFAHAQAGPLDIPSHLHGAAFGRLLRAAQGDRRQVEDWILAEQRQQPQLDRDSAIAQVALKLEATRPG